MPDRLRQLLSAARLRGASALALARLHPWKAALCLPLLVLLYVLALVPLTPGIGDLRRVRSEAPSVVLGEDGAVLAEYRRINREWVTLAQISPHVVDALIATEDRRFYEHPGIDVMRIAGAAFSTLQGDLQGGSTITQQLARNLFPEEIGRAASINRKLKEAITALKIEALYAKPEILETYLNTVPFLYNAFGIEMAARTYFDKPARALDVLESATLIGMLKGTSYYNPVQNPERARQRRNLVLAQMARDGKLQADALDTLSRRPMQLDFERQPLPLGLAPHVAQQLRRWLVDWADDRGYDIQTDGLRVVTTLDARLQKAANEAMARQMAQLQPLADARRRAARENVALQAGLVALDPRSGAVRAWVGSSDFATEQFDHVSQARRQPGSTFKPFAYGAAYLQGMTPADTLMDEPVAIRLPGGDVWSPSDATPPTNQPMTLYDGLAQSRNTVTALLMQKVGPQRVVALAQALGVRQSKLEPVLSLGLGTSPVTLIEMVTAYGTLANGGIHHPPVLLLRVEDREGRVLEQFAAPADTGPRPAMPRKQALMLVNTLRGAIDEGTGTAIRARHGITADVAGKTGTTQDNTDGWFILMSPQLVAGARVGFNDNSVTMGGWGQGARSALPMVGELFQQAFKNRWIDPKARFDVPRTRPALPEPVPTAPAPDTPSPVRDAIETLIEGIREQLR